MSKPSVAEQAASIRKLSDARLVDIYDEYLILQQARRHGVDNWDGWMDWESDDDDDEDEDED